MSDAEAPQKVTIRRDIALEQAMLAAVIDDRNDQPRSKQVAVGPSSIGFCRELLRSQLFEPDNIDLITPESTWATAAHVGQVMGADLERIFGRRLSAQEQQRITTHFDMLGVSISGAIDLLFLNGESTVTDLKGMADVGSLLYDLDKNAAIIETLLSIWREGKLYEKYVETPDGGYELTERILSGFSKLHYWVQVAVYVTGCIQAGVLPEDAEGRLVWYDRSGNFQEFVAVILDIEEIMMFFEIGQHRVMQVARAQELYEQSGNPALIFQLRDQPPSFCFSSKVMCPLRNRCWGGSDWDPSEVLESAELNSAADRYVEGRRLTNIGKGMTTSARDELKGISGVTSNGVKVGWKGNTISVVETGKRAEATSKRSAVDIAAESMARVAVAPPEPATDSQGVNRQELMEGPTFIDSNGDAHGAGDPERDERIDRVRFVDTDPRPMEATPADKVLATAPELTEAQRKYLERHTGQKADPVGDKLRAMQNGVAADRAARKAEREGK